MIKEFDWKKFDKKHQKKFQALMLDRLSKCTRYGGLRLLGGISK